MKFLLVIFSIVFSFGLTAFSQESPKEEDFYKIVTLPVPEGILLEVGGVTMMPNGSLALATRRGDIWVVENPSSIKPYFRKFASGLHEVLGLVYKNGSFYCAQRGELTKISDKNGDGKADSFETIYAWEVSGNYHEYSYGPKIAPDGGFFLSGNVAFGNEEWWRGEARAKTRGTIFKIYEDGRYEPWAAGMRSPAGLGMIDGELFYSDNQGDWMGSGGIWHVKKGAFMGHPASLKWTGIQNSPVKLSEEQFFAERDNRKTRGSNGAAIKPENIVNENFKMLYELKDKYPMVQTPVVWLPYGILGISNSEIIRDETKGDFGPFAGQVFIGDQGQSKIMRVFMEKVNGEFQGAAWDFRSGFQSGVMRMTFAPDATMFVGETNRGWGSAGDANQGLQRLVWNGKIPFEMLTCKAMPDGFEIDFTLPIEKKSAEDLASYTVSSFIYKHHPVYGSPPVNKEDLKIKGVKLSEDGKKLRIVLDGLRPYYVHELNLDGIRSASDFFSLIHPRVYYTLNSIPSGQKLAVNELKTSNSGVTIVKSKIDKEKNVVSTDGPNKPETTKKVALPISYAAIKPLLQKHTCLACHAEDKKLIGPAFKDIAKRKYSNEKIVALIYNPKPENWPDYATPMAPMPQVPKKDALTIAGYINSLK